MTPRSIVCARFLLLGLLSAGIARADDRLRVPEDIQPPYYESLAVISQNEDGSPWFVQDGDWAVIPFYRPLEAVPGEYDLLGGGDAGAVEETLLVSGHIRVTPPNSFPTSWQLRGLGAVPIVFAPWPALEAAAGDGELTFEELMSLDGVRVGMASFYLEQNHTNGLHPVSHLTLLAFGTLEGGGTFEVRAVENKLELPHVEIHLD